jgi:hypothetical protein
MLSSSLAGRASCGVRQPGGIGMARWPRNVWTTIFTYAAVFILFPILCLLAYAWVQGWF